MSKVVDWCKGISRALLDGFVDSTAGKSGPFGIVLDQTSFYAESGGQVCDTGSIKCGAGVLTVDDTKVGRYSLTPR